MKHLSCCCCGCSLKAGTILIALLEFVPLILLFGGVANGIVQTNVELNPTVLGLAMRPRKVLDDLSDVAENPSVMITNQRKYNVD